MPRENVGVLARVPLDEGGLSGHVDERTKFPRGDFREYYFRGDRKKQVVGMSMRSAATWVARSTFRRPPYASVSPTPRSRP